MSTAAQRTRRPRCGMLFFECNWFKAVGMGNEAPGGSLSRCVTARTEALRDDLSTEMDVVYPGLVSSVDDLRAAMRRFLAEEVDFVLASFTSWTEDFAWVRFLRDFPADVPVLLWCLQSETVDLADNASPDGFVAFLYQTGLVGSLEGSGSVARTADRGRRVRTICGSPATCRERVVRFAQAAKTRAILRRARIGLIQSLNEVMWSTYLDPYRVFMELGPEVTVVSFEHLRRAVQAVSDDDARGLVDELRARYAVQDDVDDGRFLESARASLGFLRLARERGLDAVAFNDVDDALHEALGLRPGFVLEDFDRAAAAVVPEGDVGMAALALALRVLTGRPSLFVEPFFLDEARNTFHAGHAGPNTHAAADPADVRIMPDTEYERSSFRFAGAPFACFCARRGPSTLVHLGPTRDGFKLVHAAVESVPMTTRIKGYASGAFRPALPVDAFFERLLSVGVTQHYLVLHGDWRPQLGDLAFVAGFENIEVS